VTPAASDPAPELALPALDDDPFDLRERDAPFALVSFLRHAG
jgi:hypothetical protein